MLVGRLRTVHGRTVPGAYQLCVLKISVIVIAPDYKSVSLILEIEGSYHHRALYSGIAGTLLSHYIIVETVADITAQAHPQTLYRVIVHSERSGKMICGLELIG